MRTARLAILIGSTIVGAGATAQPIVEWSITFTGDRHNDKFGTCVSGAGDVNSDGYDDLIVGVPHDDDVADQCGSVRVFSGRDGSVLYTLFGQGIRSYFGTTVSGAGDINADGHADIIVGAIGEEPNGTYSGRVWLFSGQDGSFIRSIDGAGPWYQLGHAVAAAGDVNNDGFDDVIIGGNYDVMTNPGRARVYSGLDGALLHTFHPWSGKSVDGAGDVDADGHADLVVSDCTVGPAGTSVAKIMSGATGAPLFTFYAIPGDDWCSGQVSGAGDVNADGVPDIIVGAPNSDLNGDRSGAARVFSGADGSVLHTWTGPPSVAYFGSSVSGAGDVNADAHADLVVGAREDDYNQLNAGSATVFSGADGSVLAKVYGAGLHHHFGWSVSSLGDFNADGLDDIVVGTPEHNSARVVFLRPFPFQSPPAPCPGDADADAAVDFQDITSILANWNQVRR